MTGKKKRSLRERGSAQDRKAAYMAHDDTNNAESMSEGDRKKVKTDSEAKRWTLPQEQGLAPLPSPGTENDGVEEETLQRCLGFSKFGTTKGMHVFGNQDGPLPPKRKRRQYRQMLHVKGIYDVPLTRDQIVKDADGSK